MKIVRIRINGANRYGTLMDQQVRLCNGDPFVGLEPTSELLLLSDVELLPPVPATKMVAVWGNSRPLLQSRGTNPTIDICYLIKPPSSFITHGQAIVLPAVSGKVIFEAELGIVIGRRCRHVTEQDAANFILGWTAVNEVTAPDLVGRDPTFAQNNRAKVFDTFGVFGPWVETEVDLSMVRIRTWQNDVVRQDFTVTDLVRSPHQIVAELSADMTLEPGDVIACGSSLGVAPMQAGDVIRIDVSGVATLVNPVVSEASARRLN